MATVRLEDGTERGKPARRPRLLAGLRTLARWALAATAASFVVSSTPARGEAPADASGIVLAVSVGSAKGRVLCGLYERNGWLKRPLQGSTSSIRSNVATCHFQGVKPGTYAVGAFHDENSNGRLDRSWTGLPREPWCLSRGPRGTFSPPPFEAASFPVAQGTVRLSCRAR
ncbi:MAG TPA: DUF2141 domain-containing protein [Polyangiaceae bacterium]